MLKMILTSLEGLDPLIAAEYKERDGKFVLDVEGAKSQADVDAVKNALEKERGISKGLKEQLAAFGDKKPEDLLPLVDKVAELEIAVANGKGKWDDKQVEAIAAQRLATQKAQDDARYAKAQDEIKTLKDENAAFKLDKQRRTIFDTVRTLATESKANPESYASELSGLMLLADRLFTVDPDTNAVIVREGIPGMAHGLHAKDVWGDVQKAHGYFWPPSQGGGSPGSRGGGDNSVNPFKANNMQARSAFIKEHGADSQRVKQAIQAAGLVNAFDIHPEKK